MDNDLYEQDIAEESEDGAVEGFQSEDYGSSVLEKIPGSSCSGPNCLPNVEFEGLEKLDSKKIPNIQKDVATPKELIEKVGPKERRQLTPQEQLDASAHSTGSALVKEIKATGAISEATLRNIANGYERAGQVGGQAAQERFMREMNLSMQKQNMFMLHHTGEAENGVVPHRIVVVHGNGSNFADGNFTSRESRANRRR